MLASLKVHLKRILQDTWLKSKVELDFNLQAALLLSRTKIKEQVQSVLERELWRTHSVSSAQTTIVACSRKDLSLTNTTLTEEPCVNPTRSIWEATKATKTKKTRFPTEKWSPTSPSLLKRLHSKCNLCSCKNHSTAPLRFKTEIFLWTAKVLMLTCTPRKMLTPIQANIFQERPQMRFRDKILMSGPISLRTSISTSGCSRPTMIALAAW